MQKRYWDNIKVLIYRLLLVLAVYQICRIVFFWNNYFIFKDIGISEFLGGMRFDLSAIFYTNALVILAHAIPGNFKYNKIYQKTLKIVFFLINLIFIGANFVDVEYFKFTSRRSTYSLITASGMESDILRLIPVFAKNYWYLLLGFILVAVLFWKLIPDLKLKPNQENETVKISKRILPYFFFLVCAGLIVFVGRGGWQRNPLKIVDAIHYTDNAVNTPLVLNTPFSILKTMSKKDNLKEIHFYSDEEISKLYNPVIQLKSEKPFQKKNIVLLILESFGEENLFLKFEGKPLTPFMDSLTQNALYYENAFANGRKSIDAVPSTILSIPCLMDVSYISSPYSFRSE